MSDHYRILGVAPGASREEIRRAFIARAQLFHPDRYDQHAQPAEWRQANDVFRQLTQAYHALNAEAESGPIPPAPEPAPPASPEPLVPASGLHLPLESLPPEVAARLAQRQAGTLAPQFRVPLGRAATGYLFSAAGFVGLIALAWLANRERWSMEATAVAWAMSIASAFLLLFGLAAIFRWHRQALKPAFTVTPVYCIEVTHRQASFWQLWDLTRVEPIRHFVNGRYQHTAITLHFGTVTRRLIIKADTEAVRFLSWLSDARREASAAVRGGNHVFLLAHDDLAELRRASTRPSRATLAPRWTVALPWSTAGVALTGLLGISALSANEYFDDRRDWQTALAFDKAGSYRTYLKEHEQGRWRAEARTHLNVVFDRSTAAYVRNRSAGFDEAGSQAMLALLRASRDAGSGTIPVYFERTNSFNDAMALQLARQLPGATVTPPGDAFSDTRMRARESSIMRAITAAMRQAMGDEVLDFAAGGGNTAGTRLLVSYTVEATDSLYFPVKEQALDPRQRHYFPGIVVNWAFRLAAPELAAPYEFRLTSRPAGTFQVRVANGRTAERGNVYDAMSESGFADFQRELAQRLGLAQGGTTVATRYR